MNRYKPLKWNLRARDPAEVRSTQKNTIAEAVGLVALCITCGTAIFFLSLMLLLAYTFHISDPADPQKVEVIAVLDIASCAACLWSLRRLQRK